MPRSPGPHADDPVAFEQDLRAGEAREDTSMPSASTSDASHFPKRLSEMTALPWLRSGGGVNGSGELPAGVEQVDAILVDVGFDRRTGSAIVGQELGERPWIEHRAREQVRPGLARLFNDCDRQRLAGLRLLQLRETQAPPTCPPVRLRR